MSFSWVSGDANPMHTDAEYAARSPLGQRVAHGALGLSVCTGLSARIGHFEGTAIALLEIREWRFHLPIFICDTVRLRTTVVEVKPTTKPGRGLVTRRMELINQREEVVQGGITTILVRTRGETPA